MDPRERVERAYDDGTAQRVNVKATCNFGVEGSDGYHACGKNAEWLVPWEYKSEMLIPRCTEHAAAELTAIERSGQ